VFFSAQDPAALGRPVPGAPGDRHRAGGTPV